MTTSPKAFYNFFAKEPFMESFKNPFSNKPFIDLDLVVGYGELW